MKILINFIKAEPRNLTCVLSLVIVLFLIGDLFGANAAKKPDPVQIKPKHFNAGKTTLQQQQRGSKISKKSVKVFIDAVQIYGAVAKPQAIFIISATDPKVDGLKINRHFFDDIFRTVEKSSLKRVRKKQAKKNKDIIQW